MKSLNILICVVVMAGILIPSIAGARSCAEQQPILVFACDEGRCKRGFVVEYVVAGLQCLRRPVVTEWPVDDGGMLEEAISRDRASPSGIFEVRWDTCKGDRRGNDCPLPTNPHQAVEDGSAAALEAHKQYWQREERNHEGRHLWMEWSGSAILVLVPVVLVLWPVSLLRRWNRIGFLRRSAVPIWILVTLALAGHLYGRLYYAYYPAWMVTGFFVSYAMLLAVFVEFCWFTFKAVASTWRWFKTPSRPAIF